MRLKEIKPGMVIHCKTQEEANELCDAVGASKQWKEYWVCYKDYTCYEIGHKMIAYGPSYSYRDRKTTEFSDLILSELTVEEVLKIRNELDAAFVRDYLGIFCETSLDKMLRTATPEQIIDMCHQWKAIHEKKEPEIETVDICRIIEVLPDGRKRCVHEETIKKPITLEVEETLKRYCMEHDGDFIAVHEVVSRVKR